MEALLVPSIEDGRCPELLGTGAEACGCEALLTAWGEGILHSVWVSLVSAPIGCGGGNWAVCGEE